MNTQLAKEKGVFYAKAYWSGLITRSDALERMIKFKDIHHWHRVAMRKAFNEAVETMEKGALDELRIRKAKA